MSSTTRASLLSTGSRARSASKGCSGQCAEACAPRRAGARRDARARGRVDALIGDLAAPERSLRAQAIVDVPKLPTVEEGVADASEWRPRRGPWPGVAHGSGDRLEEVVSSAKARKCGVKLHGAADVVQHHRFQVVVQKLLRHAAKGRERALVHAQKRVGLLLEREVDKEHARLRTTAPSQTQTAALLRRADADLAEGAPVHLRFLARLRLDPQVGFSVALARGADLSRR